MCVFLPSFFPKGNRKLLRSVARRVEVEYGVLRSYGGGDCNKEGAAGALLWQDRTTFCEEHLIYGEIKRHENI